MLAPTPMLTSVPNPSTHADRIDCDSSYPMLDRIVFNSANMFEMDDALLKTLGTRSKFKSFHTKRQGKVAYHLDAYFREEMEDIVGYSLLH